MALTKRQYQVLQFLDSFINLKGYCPSYNEIRKNLKLSSLATIHKHINTLEKKGFIVMKLGKPIKYIAIPPTEVVDRVKKNGSTNGSTVCQI